MKISLLKGRRYAFGPSETHMRRVPSACAGVSAADSRLARDWRQRTWPHTWLCAAGGACALSRPPRPSPRAPVVNPRSSLYVRSYPAAASPTASNPDAHHSSDPHADTPAEPAHTKAHRHPQPGGAQRPRGAGAVRQDLQAETDQTRIHSGRAGPAFPGLSLLAGPSCRRVASKDQDVS